MKDNIIVRRYADAFVEVAREVIGLQRCVDEMKRLGGIFRECPEFEEFLGTEEVSPIEKADFLDRVLKESFSEETRNFLKFLIHKGRINRIVDIIDYVRVEYAHEDEVDAVLRSASMMDLDLLDEVKTALERTLHKKLNLHLELDPSLLGGVQVVIGHRIFDGSARRRLLELGEKLKTAKVV